MSQRNLIILRAGDGSLHPQWQVGATPDFDLFISYYGKQAGRHQADATYYEHRPGPKWSCIGELLASRPELLDRYDAFWFPDDDLAADAHTLNRMFALFHGFGLALAQPALTQDSFYSWDLLLQDPRYVLRHTGFVEVMAPIFSRAALKACLPTFTESRSGWGLDFVWPQLAARGSQRAIAVIDATPVRHTRALGGNLYANNPDLDPRADRADVVTRYQAQRAMVLAPHTCHGGVRLSGLGWWDALKWAWRRKYALHRMRQRRRQGKAEGL
ncbi:DUF707 domain-containing protein [Ideonella livida]|uniref:DUF707 domain-containing protein n=1 Tax=Ideonella livida TaxID=2707176 RepID=A0A7C9PI31_9BURK|nr:DUF707 domain-containing protein [Ideonella livida]NDY92349.1 DUF707 domain-containing protein [Ideonella livida]